MARATWFGVYEVLAPIGRGGAGTVYRARSPAGDVAIKLLQRADAEAFARFERERRLQATLGEAEGFVPLLDAGLAPEGPYLVMPLLAGGTLRDRLERGALPIEEAIDLGAALAAALARAHEQGIVHRDMKPENVIFKGDGTPLIADLGLAKHFRATPGGESAALSKTGDFHGTFGYMSPEQMRDAKAAGPAADVFGLGAILYECLAGAPAFDGATVLEMLDGVERGAFRPLGEARPGTPRWLARVVARALARDPASRFEDGRAFARALEGPGAGSRATSIALAAMLVLVAAAGTLAVIASGRGPGHATGPAAPRTPLPAASPPTPTPILPPLRASPPVSSAGRESVIVWHDRGDAKLQAGDATGALEDFNRALEIDPDHVASLNDRGAARGRTGDVRGGIEDCTRAIRLSPGLALAWSNRGGMRETEGDHAGAIEDCTRAIELDPRNRIALTTRAVAKGKLLDRDGAIDDVTRVIELDPSVALPWINRAWLEDAKGDGARAIADFEKYLELAPDGPKAASARKSLERLKAAR
jgi:tetratricopeptide (TPR) repeat protein